MYGADSFFTLSLADRFGLLVLSALLAAAVLVLAWRLMARAALWRRLLIAAVLFAMFVWLSPQVYYLYYIAILDGLPWQWVIRALPPETFVRLATFTGPATLSAHGSGVLFWVLILLAFRGSAQRAPDL